LATVVLAAVYGLQDFPALLRFHVLPELQAELVDRGILLGIEDEVGRLDRTMTLVGLLAANLQV
jgi:hypothetical protein